MEWVGEMKKYVYVVLTVALVAFIWHNSLQDAVQSEKTSLAFVYVVQILMTWMKVFVSNGVMDHIIRKAAHLTEFALLGCLLSLTVLFFVQTIQKRVAITLLLGLAVACMDEYLQLFSAGRGCQLSDVGIDFIGVCIGCLMGVLIRRKIYAGRRFI